MTRRARHSVAVTNDRLQKEYERFYDLLDADDRFVLERAFLVLDRLLDALGGCHDD